MPRLSGGVAASGGGRRASRGGNVGPPHVTDGPCERCYHGRRRWHREPPPARPPVTGGRRRRGRGLPAAWPPPPHPRSRRRWRNRRRRHAAAPYSGGATAGSGGGGGGGGGDRQHRPLPRRRPRARSALRDYSFGVTPLPPRGVADVSFWTDIPVALSRGYELSPSSLRSVGTGVRQTCVVARRGICTRSKVGKQPISHSDGSRTPIP